MAQRPPAMQETQYLFLNSALKQPHLFANDTGHWRRGRGSAGIVHLFPVVSAGLSHAAVVGWQVSWLVLEGFAHFTGNWLELLVGMCGRSSSLPQAFLYSIWLLRGQEHRLDILLYYSIQCWSKQATWPAYIKGKGNSLHFLMGGIAKSPWTQAENRDESNCCGHFHKQSIYHIDT